MEIKLDSGTPFLLSLLGIIFMDRHNETDLESKPIPVVFNLKEVFSLKLP